MSQAVTWRTSVDVTKVWGEIAIADPSFESKAKKVDADSQPLTTNLSSAHYDTVEFTVLKPETRYVYQVGDAQNNIRSLWSRVVREASP